MVHLQLHSLVGNGALALYAYEYSTHTVRPHTHLLVEFNHPSNEASTECRVEGVGNDEQIFGGKGLHVHLRGGREGEGVGPRVGKERDGGM